MTSDWQVAAVHNARRTNLASVKRNNELSAGRQVMHEVEKELTGNGKINRTSGNTDVAKPVEKQLFLHSEMTVVTTMDSSIEGISGLTRKSKKIK